MNVEQIAQVCHEANRAYCKTIGDNSQPSWDDAPDWQKQSAIKGVEFHLEELASGGTPKPEASHENWLKEKVANGWVYGETKDADAKTHPCCVPYSELPRDQQRKDYIFIAVVKAFFKTANINE